MVMKHHSYLGKLMREDMRLAFAVEVTEVACWLGVLPASLSRVVNGHTGVSADLAVRPKRAAVSTIRFWMNLWSNQELAQAEQHVQANVQPLQAIACRVR